jgi:hypothetical protein
MADAEPFVNVVWLTLSAQGAALTLAETERSVNGVWSIDALPPERCGGLEPVGDPQAPRAFRCRSCGLLFRPFVEEWRTVGSATSVGTYESRRIV